MSATFTIGVAGHVDHGKTALVRALTGIDTDRKAEEKTRGLSIESGVATMTLPGGGSVAMIDVPGHTDFLKNTIRGLNSVDMALLVVAADDGVMPQTREHLEILKFFKAAGGVVVLSKTDLVDGETLDLAEMELSELLSGTFLDQCPIFKFSQRRPELGAEIKTGIDTALNKLPAKKADAPFRMWIDQVRSIRGHGTVVSGTVVSGTIHSNDDVELLSAGITTRARSLESHACAVPHVVAGQRVGMNLHRLPLREARRGMCLVSPGTIRPGFLLNVELSILETAKKGIQNRQKVKVYLGTAVTKAMVVLTEKNRLEPGETGLAQIRLVQPVAALPRDPFVISPLNLNTIIAGGRVLEIAHQKLRVSNTATILPPLRALQQKDVDAYMQSVFDRAQDRLISAKLLSEQTGLPALQFERRLSAKVQKGEWIYFKGHGAIKKEHLASLQNQFKAVIEAIFRENPMKKHIMLAEIAEHLGLRLDNALVQTAADALCESGEIIRLGGGFRPAGCAPTLSASEDAQVAFVLDYMQAAGLTPISPQFFWKENRPPYSKAKAVRLFNYLHTQNRLIRLNGNRFISIDALEEIKKRVASAIRDAGSVTLGDCKLLFGYGRSAGAHVLDYLNQIGFTVRRKDKHYRNEDGADDA
jgi:selenocysteine-specific elongation factor